MEKKYKIQKNPFVVPKIDGELVVLEAGQSILIQKGARIRYSNPFEEECEYLAICLPAFSMDLVNREE